MFGKPESDSRYTRTPELEVNEVPDGYVVYQSSKDRVHFLNPVAAVIFELCNGNHTTHDIRSILVEGYELSSFPDRDFETALGTMLTEGLIQPCAPASS
jgi:hypothetical protein